MAPPIIVDMKLNATAFKAGIAAVNTSMDAFGNKALSVSQIVNKLDGDGNMISQTFKQMARDGTAVKSTFKEVMGQMRLMNVEIKNVGTLSASNAKKFNKFSKDILDFGDIQNKIPTQKIKNLQRELVKLRDLMSKVDTKGFSLTGSNLSLDRRNPLKLDKELVPVQQQLQKVQQLRKQIVDELDREVQIRGRVQAQAERMNQRLDAARAKAAEAEKRRQEQLAKQLDREIQMRGRIQAQAERMNQRLDEMRAKRIEAEKRRQEQLTKKLDREIQMRGRIQAQAERMNQKIDEMRAKRVEEAKREREGRRVERRFEAVRAGLPENISVQGRRAIDAADAALARMARTGKITNAQIGQIWRDIEAGSRRAYRGAEAQAASYIDRAIAGTKRLKVSNEEAVASILLSWRNITRFLTYSVLQQGFYTFTNAVFNASRESMEFEKIISRIRTISRENQLAFSVWADQVSRLSSEFNTPLLDTARATYETVSNQIGDGTIALEQMRAALTLSITTGASAMDSMNALASTLNSFKLGMSRSAEVSGQLFATIDYGRIRMDELAYQLGRVGVVANSLGMDFAEVGAALAIITNNGVPTAEALTQLFGLFDDFLKPTDEMRAALRSFGFESGAVAVRTLGLVQTMNLLRNYARDTGIEMTKLFNEIRGYRAKEALFGTDENTSYYARQIETIRKASEDMEEVIQIARESTGFRLSQEFQELSNTITTGLAAALNTLTLRMFEASDGTVKITEALTTLGNVAVGLVLAFSAMRVAAFLFSTAVNLNTTSLAQNAAALATSTKNVAAYALGLKSLSATASATTVTVGLLTSALAGVAAVGITYALSQWAASAEEVRQAIRGLNEEQQRTVQFNIQQFSSQQSKIAQENASKLRDTEKVIGKYVSNVYTSNRRLFAEAMAANKLAAEASKVYLQSFVEDSVRAVDKIRAQQSKVIDEIERLEKRREELMQASASQSVRRYIEGLSGGRLSGLTDNMADALVSGTRKSINLAREFADEIDASLNDQSKLERIAEQISKMIADGTEESLKLAREFAIEGQNLIDDRTKRRAEYMRAEAERLQDRLDSLEMSREERKMRKRLDEAESKGLRDFAKQLENEINTLLAKNTETSINYAKKLVEEGERVAVDRRREFERTGDRASSREIDAFDAAIERLFAQIDYAEEQLIRNALLKSKEFLDLKDPLNVSTFESAVNNLAAAEVKAIDDGIVARKAELLEIQRATAATQDLVNQMRISMKILEDAQATPEQRLTGNYPDKFDAQIFANMMAQFEQIREIATKAGVPLNLEDDQVQRGMTDYVLKIISDTAKEVKSKIPAEVANAFSAAGVENVADIKYSSEAIAALVRTIQDQRKQADDLDLRLNSARAEIVERFRKLVDVMPFKADFSPLTLRVPGGYPRGKRLSMIASDIAINAQIRDPEVSAERLRESLEQLKKEYEAFQASAKRFKLDPEKTDPTTVAYFKENITALEAYIQKVEEYKNTNLRDTIKENEEKLRALRDAIQETTTKQNQQAEAAEDVVIGLNSIDSAITRLSANYDGLAASAKNALDAMQAVSNVGGSTASGTVERKATGGRAWGTDTVPAMLTPGEFVVRREATKKYLPLLYEMNAMRFAKGGLVAEGLNARPNSRFLGEFKTDYDYYLNKKIKSIATKLLGQDQIMVNGVNISTDTARDLSEVESIVTDVAKRKPWAPAYFRDINGTGMAAGKLRPSVPVPIKNPTIMTYLNDTLQREVSVRLDGNKDKDGSSNRTAGSDKLFVGTFGKVLTERQVSTAVDEIPRTLATRSVANEYFKKVRENPRLPWIDPNTRPLGLAKGGIVPSKTYSRPVMTPNAPGSTSNTTYINTVAINVPQNTQVNAREIATQLRAAVREDRAKLTRKN